MKNSEFQIVFLVPPAGLLQYPAANLESQLATIFSSEISNNWISPSVSKFIDSLNLLANYIFLELNRQIINASIVLVFNYLLRWNNSKSHINFMNTIIVSSIHLAIAISLIG